MLLQIFEYLEHPTVLVEVQEYITLQPSTFWSPWVSMASPLSIPGLLLIAKLLTLEPAQNHPSLHCLGQKARYCQIGLVERMGFLWYDYAFHHCHHPKLQPNHPPYGFLVCHSKCICLSLGYFDSYPSWCGIHYWPSTWGKDVTSAHVMSIPDVGYKFVKNVSSYSSYLYLFQCQPSSPISNHLLTSLAS